VLADLAGRVPFIIDGGASPAGLESTIVDCTVDPPVLLRPGIIGQRDLELALQRPIVRAGSGTPHKAPGMKYIHYAPQSPVIWINMRDGDAIARRLESLRQEFGTIALFADNRWSMETAQAFVEIGQDVNTAAHNLFTGFRELDRGRPGAIVVVWPQDERGAGLAVINRLGKASSRQVRE
jgi:L-threonylcarbamoyladenylate synthase